MADHNGVNGLMADHNSANDEPNVEKVPFCLP